MRLLEKGKVNPRELSELVDEAHFTNLAGFPLSTKMKAIQHEALTGEDLRGFALVPYCCQEA